MTPGKVRFVFALHCHQPVGNFDHVIEEAYERAYRPLMEVMGRHPSIPFVVHYSGSLLEWLEEHQPAFCAELGDRVRSGQMEMMGGGYYEPIFTMLPERDMLGQVRTYSAHLKAHYGARVRGAWVPERVWEPHLASQLARAGIQYTALDDHHFKAAGVGPEQLTGYYTTEDQGHLVSVFPISEELRYRIPFATPERCIDHLLELADRGDESLVVYADDGEKFGTWPGTYKLIYEEGWLERFLTLLEKHHDRIEPVTFAQAMEQVEPVGRVYLPDGSYREMTEWALPAEQLVAYEDEVKELTACGRHQVGSFLRGGSWRNFKTKYEEANCLYARMLLASEAVASVVGAGREYMEALTHLYRGQCNCTYWHGIFGGLYLPHLRDAAYHHLITAHRIARSVRAEGPRLVVSDLDLDGRDEILMENDQLSLFIKPSLGAQIYELDLIEPAINIVNTLTRRPEAYHRALTDPPAADAGEPAEAAASIHEAIGQKEEGLGERLQYDRDRRTCLIDRLLPVETTAEQMQTGSFVELAGFGSYEYGYHLVSSSDPLSVSFRRSGFVGKARLTLTKKILIPAEGGIMEVDYTLRNEGGGEVECLFTSELNFSMQTGAAPDRYYRSAAGENLGLFGSRLDLASVGAISLVDEWRQLSIDIASDPGCDLWTYPVETVSISEGGLERIFQAACVIPRWRLALKGGSTFEARVTMQLHSGPADEPAESAGRRPAEVNR